jgi:hypothetical protein
MQVSQSMLTKKCDAFTLLDLYSFVLEDFPEVGNPVAKCVVCYLSWIVFYLVHLLVNILSVRIYMV